MWGAGGPGVAAASVSLIGARDCFLHLPPGLASSLRLQQDQAVKTSWDNQTIFLGWTEIRHCHQYGGNIIEINRQLAEKLGIRDGQQIFLEPCSQVLSCQQVEVEPLSADDWEILELHAFSLESHLLDQIRIVFPKAIFPVWVEQHTCIYIQIVTLKPAALYGRLEARTELFIRPKLREHGECPAMVPSEKNDILQDIVSKTKLETRGTTKELGAKETNLSMGVQEQKPETKASLSANVLPNIWNLIGSIFSYSSDKKQEASCGAGQLDSVKDSLLNLIHMDSIFRVCHIQPPSIQTTLAASTFQNYNTIHVFPWHLEFPPLDTSVKISYGRMSKLLSPRQQHQESKQNLLSNKEKQMINAEDQKQSSLSKSQESNEISIVQIVWSGFEDLKSTIMCNTNVEQIHIGRVWVSPISETCRRTGSVLSQMWKICSLINITI